MSNQSLDVLLSLPRELVFCILSEWVGLKELSGLDKAYCNHEKRCTLLTIFSSVRRGSLGEEVSVSQTKYIAWVTQRQIRQSEFYVNGTMSDFAKYFKVFGMHVKRLTIECDKDTMANTLSLCSRLRTLYIIDGEECKETVNAILNCSQLRELRVGFAFRRSMHQQDFPLSIKSEAMKSEAPLQPTTLLVTDGWLSTAKVLGMTSPTVLRSLQVTLSPIFTGADLHQFLSKGCNLTALCLSGSVFDVDVVSLLQLCPNLRHFDLNCSRMTEECLPALAIHLSSLQLTVLRIACIACIRFVLDDLLKDYHR